MTSDLSRYAEILRLLLKAAEKGASSLTERERASVRSHSAGLLEILKSNRLQDALRDCLDDYTSIRVPYLEGLTSDELVELLEMTAANPRDFPNAIRDRNEIFRILGDRGVPIPQRFYG